MTQRNNVVHGHRWLARGMADRAQREFWAAVRQHKGCDPPDRYLEAVTGLAEAQYRAPRTNAYETTKRLLRTVADDASSADVGLRSRAFEQLARLEAISGSCERAIDAAQRIPESDPAAPRAERWALVGPYPLRDKRRATRRLLASLTPTSSPEEWWTVHTWMLVDALESGDRDRADRELDACRRLSATVEDPFIRMLTQTWESAVLVLSGKFSDAEAHISVVLDDTAGLELNTGGLAAQRTYLTWERGERGGTINLISDMVEAVPDRSDLHRAVLADLLAADGRSEEASFEIDRLALDDFGNMRRDRDWLPAMVRIAHACVRLERTDLADQVRDLLSPMRDRTVVGGGMPYLFLGAVAHYTGALALVAAEPDAALIDLAMAAEIYQRLGARPWLAATRCEQARALMARGERVDASVAQSLLKEAADEADNLGMRPLSERTARLRRDPPSRVAVEPTFCREGEGWTLAYGTLPVHIPDSKGMRGLHHLLGRPGVAVPAVALAADVVGDRVTSAERARVNVTRQMRSAIDRIGEYVPELAAHLTTAVVTGQECAYRPPTEPPVWQLAPLKRWAPRPAESRSDRLPTTAVTSDTQSRRATPGLRHPGAARCEAGDRGISTQPG